MAYENLMEACAAHASEQASQSELMDAEEARMAQTFKRDVLERPEVMIVPMVDLMGFANIDWNVMRAISAAAKAGIPEAVLAVNQMARMYASQNTFTE